MAIPLRTERGVHHAVTQNWFKGGPLGRVYQKGFQLHNISLRQRTLGAYSIQWDLTAEELGTQEGHFPAVAANWKVMSGERSEQVPARSTVRQVTSSVDIVTPERIRTLQRNY